MKKKFILSALIMLSTFLSQASEKSSVDAFVDASGDCQERYSYDDRHQFYVGFNHAYRRMYFNNPGKVDGFVTGAEAGFNFKCGCLVSLFQYSGYWTAPDLRGNPCQRSRLNEHMGTFGIGFRYCRDDSDYDIDILTGAGFTRLYHHQDPSSLLYCNTTSGLKYKYTKVYMPLMLRMRYYTCAETVFQLFAQWRPDVYSRIQPILGNTSSGSLLPCRKLTNTREFGLRISCGVEHLVGDEDIFFASFNPYFDWNRFGDLCIQNSNGSTYRVDRLKRWDLGFYALAGVQF